MRKIALLLLLVLLAVPYFARAEQAPGTMFSFPVLGTVPCGVVCPDGNSLPQNVCADPAPLSVSYVTTTPAPMPPDGKKMILELRTAPMIDWDPFICADGGVMVGPNLLGETCDNYLGPDHPVFVGCMEIAQGPVTGGKAYRIGVINRSDIADCPAWYTWVLV